MPLPEDLRSVITPEHAMSLVGGIVDKLFEYAKSLDETDPNVSLGRLYSLMQSEIRNSKLARSAMGKVALTRSRTQAIAMCLRTCNHDMNLAALAFLFALLADSARQMFTKVDETNLSEAFDAIIEVHELTVTTDPAIAG